MKLYYAIYGACASVTSLISFGQDRNHGPREGFFQTIFIYALIGLLWPLRCWIWFVDWKDNKIENDYR